MRHRRLRAETGSTLARCSNCCSVWPGMLAHRGPDAETFMIDQRRSGSAHRRLSIIDVEGGDNPLEDPETAPSLWCSTARSTTTLIAARRARSQGRPAAARGSDGEVHRSRLSRLWASTACWPGSVACSPSLSTIAVIGRVLYLARDPFGIKPLYHSINPGCPGVRLGNQSDHRGPARPMGYFQTRAACKVPASASRWHLRPSSSAYSACRRAIVATWREGRLELSALTTH